MNRVFLSLGSNIGDRAVNLEEAIALLKSVKGVSEVNSSPIYETLPVGYIDQANFLNIVLEVYTTLKPEILLEVCQGIESNLGRKRVIKNGPRIIDLDILLYEEIILDLPHLQIPHPRMHERAFVLIPFQAIDDNVVWPHTGEKIKDLIKKMNESDIAGVKKWDRAKRCDTITDSEMSVKG